MANAKVVLPDNTLKVLMCNNCKTYLSRGPVYQQRDGTAICKQCHSREPQLLVSRNMMYEFVATLMRFPCRYREFGCPATVPFVAEDEEGPAHEATCQFRYQVPCVQCSGTPSLYDVEDGRLCENCSIR